ncbi:MAG: DUF2851 family protein [Bacteroidales bacterium]|jgi:hypothetical protein|nr:DUF2851 family protein [Bacteroidales bacterium]
MTEDFLHYVWKHRLYLTQDHTAIGGEKIEVLHPGIANTHAGPDFSDARIRIGTTLWAGCVEIHICSSDWEKHGHHHDPAYNNVILHVVYQHDTDVYTENGQKLPVLELHFDDRYYENYLQLAGKKETIACKEKLGSIDEFTWMAWLDRMAIERLEQKSNDILRTYSSTGNNWEETFYRRLARNFGFSLNGLPFETLAKSLPYHLLLKHKDHPDQLEALLFGQAGMLQDKYEDAYYTGLQDEYLFLRNKYQLVPIESHLWKFLRLRPVNFPTVRIAQFADLIHRNDHLFSRIIGSDTTRQLEEMFTIRASGYWDTHYVFGKDAVDRKKTFGKTAFHSVMINTVIPFLFVYGKVRSKEDFCIRAIDLLQNLPPEKNTILTLWHESGVDNPTALTSQALLQLKNEYCMSKRCLHCAVGNKIVNILD